MDDNTGGSKKSSLRKKVVDLKAVAALLEESDGTKSADSVAKTNPARGAFQPNEDLIQAAARVKSQRDLIKKRCQKMEQSRDKVSKSVFDKVYRDYAMQLDTINKLFNEKKGQLNRELKNFYTLREKQELDIHRHREILEEARFRHFLDEYTEEQYKEVEEYETKEIQHLQSELAQIQAYIKVHEELFDPEDLGFASPEALRGAPRASGSAPQWAEKTPIPHSKKPPQAAPKETTGSRILPTAESREDLDFVMAPEEEGYFAGEVSEPSITTAGKEEPSINPPPYHPESTKEIGLKKPASQGTSAGLSGPVAGKAPESIFDVLEDIPLEPEGREIFPPVTEPKATKEGVPTRYKLVLIEGDSDLTEFEMKDNVSIGRSPSNDLVLNAPRVSRQHAAINKYKDQYIIIDLKSSNGIYVNGRKCDEHALNEGDQISIGGYKFAFQKI